MKWKDFKEWLEDNGVNDDTELAYEDPNFGGNNGDFDLTNVVVDDELNELRIESQYWEPVD
jgi:hypothetical protein